MTLLLENPLPIWALGAVCLTISVIVFLAKRSLGSILGVAAVVATTLLLLSLERAVVTPTEELEQSVATVLAAIEANDLNGVLARIDPQATHVRHDAETLMPQVKVKETGATAVRVEIDPNVKPAKATTFFRGRIDGMHVRNSVRLFYFDQVEIDWHKPGETWLITDYRASFRGKPVKASDGFRGTR